MQDWKMTDVTENSQSSVHVVIPLSELCFRVTTINCMHWYRLTNFFSFYVKCIY